MDDPLKKVQPGDPLQIPAASFNMFIDAARAHRDRQHTQDQGAQPTMRTGGMALVKNASGADQDRFAVLGINTPIILPTDNLNGFKNRVAFNVVVPTADHAEKFVILTEPLAAGRLGKGMVSGVTPVKLSVQSEDDEYAAVKVGETGFLETGQGPAQILWKEPGTGTKWGIVQFPFSLSDTEYPKIAKFDGSRTGACYTGHIKEDGGGVGAACRWKFPNDPGVENLLDANDYVMVWPAPGWDTTGWSGSGEKYWAQLTPWAAMK